MLILFGIILVLVGLCLFALIVFEARSEHREFGVDEVGVLTYSVAGLLSLFIVILGLVTIFSSASL